MTSFKACILLLVAAATAKAVVIPNNAVVIPDNVSANLDAIRGAVYFRNSFGEVWHVVAGSNCAKFPGWLNDQSVEYSIDSTYTCMVFENDDCSGRSAQIYITNNQWVPVPQIGGISAIECFFVNNN